MTLSTALALFVAMVVLAALPGPGILVVVSRALQGGLSQGIITSVGIVAGDFVFIILSVFGLVALAESMGNFFVWVKYLGAAYLSYLGLSLILNRPSKDDVPQARVSASNGFANFTAGLLTTLSNPKAILFYLSFFPAFLDLTDVSLVDLAIILAVTTAAVGGVMIFYAYLAVKTHSALRASQQGKWLSYVSGCLLIISGAFLAFRE